MNKIPLTFKKYFWDIDFHTLNLVQHQDYIIERLLEYGNSEACRWLKENYSQKAISEVLAKSRKLSQKTKNFWQVVS